MKRRSFLKWSAALGAMVAATGGGLFYGLKAASSSPKQENKVLWTACTVNCGSSCLLRAHVTDGVVTRIETDNLGDDEYGSHQVRACLRGRSMRHRMYAPERLKYPLRRTGKRGEGKFERVSWEQAYDDIAARLRKTLAEHGNEAVYINYGTGTTRAVISDSYPPQATSVARLMNLMGGYLNHYGDYSTAQMRRALYFMFGDGWVNGNTFADFANTKLVVFFGNNPAETRMGGGSNAYDLLKVKKEHGAKVILIDPRHTDTAAVMADEWIPIRPGTDAALVSALAHVMIAEDLVDHDFLKRCTVGFDEESMPEDVPAGNSYTAYILGQAADKTPKTPAWAAPITGIPEQRIIQLAREIAQAKPCFIAQGWSSQRHANGEQSTRAICALAMLTGNVGVQGGNTGAREGTFGIGFAPFPIPPNPVKTSISVFTWTDAIARGEDMTATRDGVMGRDRLAAPIKFMWNFAGNTIINQHSDINRTRKILEDDAKCETIVVIDNFMTSSAAFADYVLPATITAEERDFVTNGWNTDMGYLLFAEKVVEPFFESRTLYDICAGVAERMGVGEAYTEGRTRDDWVKFVYEAGRKKLTDLPEDMEEAFAMGVYKRKRTTAPGVPYKAFHDDPEKNPLKTPSGRLEIFSKQLWEIGRTWELPEGSRITGVPEYDPAWEGLADPLREKYPLQLMGQHYKQRTHSTYGNVDWLNEVAPQTLWINPLDARERGIEHGDLVRIFNDRGAVVAPAKVTPRIMPGVLTLPQGAWLSQDAQGVDRAGCINVLTSLRPSPLAKGNPQHTNLVQVVKA